MPRDIMMVDDGGGISLEPVKTASQLDAIAQGVQTNAANTIKALQDLGVGGSVTPQPFTQPMTIAGQTSTTANLDTGGDTVTNWRSGLTAKKGTPLGDLFEKQNADRAIRDAAYAAKPTTDPGAGYYWQWQERNQTWARIKSTGFGSTTPTGGGGGGNTGSGGNAPVVTQTSTPTNVNTPAVPTLARDVFKNTLALLFGQAEVGKGWMDELYTTVSKYYKTGASAEESFNLAIQDVRNNPSMQEFTKRFKGIYALQDLRQQGKPVTVPTIAEYFATQTKMADLLKSTGLGEIATEDFLGDVIGKGVSATEFGNRITNIFDRIDLAPQEMKDTLARYYPTLDRVQLAKALALGEKGSIELQKNLATYEVLAAAEEQGLGALGVDAIAGGLTEERAASIAAAGENFQSALGKFKTVAQLKDPAAKLAAIYGTEPMTQADIENIIFKQSAQETMALENLVKAEEAMFSGRAGTIGSRSFASQARGLGQI